MCVFLTISPRPTSLKALCRRPPVGAAVSAGAKYLMPSKLYSALAAGCFIVAITDPSCELSRIVDEEAVGVVISPENAAALTRTIIDYAEMPDAIDLVSHRSRQVAIGRFDRQLSSIHSRNCLVLTFAAAWTQPNGVSSCTRSRRSCPGIAVAPSTLTWHFTRHQPICSLV